MNVPFDLRAEIEKRDLGFAELAKAAGLSRTAVARIASGESPGRPRTRRVLREALRQFPPVENLEVQAPSPASLAAPAEKPRRLGSELLAEHLKTPKEWQPRTS